VLDLGDQRRRDQDQRLVSQPPDRPRDARHRLQMSRPAGRAGQQQSHPLNLSTVGRAADPLPFAEERPIVLWDLRRRLARDAYTTIALNGVRDRSSYECDSTEVEECQPVKSSARRTPLAGPVGVGRSGDGCRGVYPGEDASGDSRYRPVTTNTV
jgi:hypothetical protein